MLRFTTYTLLSTTHTHTNLCSCYCYERVQENLLVYHALQANCKTLSVLEWHYLVPEEEEEKIFNKAVCHHRGPLPKEN